MTISAFRILSSVELSSVAGGDGVGFEPAGVSCEPDTRNIWQRYAPSNWWGRPDPSCVEHPARVYFTSAALQPSGEGSGKRMFKPNAVPEIIAAGAKLP